MTSSLSIETISAGSAAHLVAGSHVMAKPKTCPVGPDAEGSLPLDFVEVPRQGLSLGKFLEVVVRCAF